MGTKKDIQTKLKAYIQIKLKEYGPVVLIGFIIWGVFHVYQLYNEAKFLGTWEYVGEIQENNSLPKKIVFLKSTKEVHWGDHSLQDGQADGDIIMIAYYGRNGVYRKVTLTSKHIDGNTFGTSGLKATPYAEINSQTKLLKLYSSYSYKKVSDEIVIDPSI